MKPGFSVPGSWHQIAGVVHSSILFLAAIGVTSQSQCRAADEPSPSVRFHDTVQRTIVKEPEYVAKPKYALLVLDTAGKSKVWIVEDGERLFVDKNGNGDLSDDGSPLEPQNRRDRKSDFWDFDYSLDEFTPTGPKVTKFRLMHWKYPDSGESHGLSLTLNGIKPMYAGWFGLWSDSPDTAPVIHFGGELQPRKLRGQQFVLGNQEQRLSIAFINPGRSTAENARLSIDALPESVVPVAEIEWPVAPGQPALRTTTSLSERCCYWEFYDSHFRVPEGAVAGMAKVTVSIPAEVLTFEYARQTVEVPVLTAEDAARQLQKSTRK